MATVTLEYLGKQPREAGHGFVETRVVNAFQWDSTTIGKTTLTA